MILIDLSQVIISNLMTQVGKNTDDIFSGKKKISEIQISEHMVQPSWFQGNYPPGGAILITANLFYALQGYDYSLFWDYSPEDLSFLKSALALSDSGELITWEEEKPGCNVYHLHHERSYTKDVIFANMDIWKAKQKTNYIQCISGIEKLD